MSSHGVRERLIQCVIHREFIAQMASHFLASNQGSLLYLIKVLSMLNSKKKKQHSMVYTAATHTNTHTQNSCQFMLKTFKEDTREIQEFFRILLFRGKRDVRAISCVHQPTWLTLLPPLSGNPLCLQNLQQATGGRPVHTVKETSLQRKAQPQTANSSLRGE